MKPRLTTGVFSCAKGKAIGKAFPASNPRESSFDAELNATRKTERNDLWRRPTQSKTSWRGMPSASTRACNGFVRVTWSQSTSPSGTGASLNGELLKMPCCSSSPDERRHRPNHERHDVNQPPPPPCFTSRDQCQNPQ